MGGGTGSLRNLMLHPSSKRTCACFSHPRKCHFLPDGDFGHFMSEFVNDGSISDKEAEGGEAHDKNLSVEREKLTAFTARHQAMVTFLEANVTLKQCAHPFRKN